MKTALAWAALGVLMMVATGCSTIRPVHSGRAGFLDRMKSSQASRRPGIQMADREPGAKAVAAATVSTGDLKGLRLQWPLRQVSVTSSFGHRGDQFHEGLDLRAPKGTPVYAAESGVVLYADKRIGGYGKMVVVRHANGLATVYAHNSRLLVRKGQPVRRGEKLALSGSSGHSTGPHLHFEIRKGVAAVDPSAVLPRDTRWAVDKPAERKRAVAVLRKPVKGARVAR